MMCKCNMWFLNSHIKVKLTNTTPGFSADWKEIQFRQDGQRRKLRGC